MKVDIFHYIPPTRSSPIVSHPLEVLLLLKELGEADDGTVNKQAAYNRHGHRWYLYQRTVRQEHRECCVAYQYSSDQSLG